MRSDDMNGKKTLQREHTNYTGKTEKAGEGYKKPYGTKKDGTDFYGKKPYGTKPYGTEFRGAKPYGLKPDDAGPDGARPKPHSAKSYGAKAYGAKKYPPRPYIGSANGAQVEDRAFPENQHYKNKPYENNSVSYLRKPTEHKTYRGRKPETPSAAIPAPEETLAGTAQAEESTADIQYVIGRNAVMELLKTGRNIDKLYVKKGERGGSLNVIVAESLNRGIPLAEVDGDRLDRMADGVAHQGVIASAAAKDYCQVEDILKIAEEKGEKPLILIADGIEDPYNLGAVIRVAECAGVHGIILGKHRAVGLTGAVSKASAGALEHMPIARVSNLARTVDKLKEAGVWIYAAEAGGVAYYECDMETSAAIILGSEGFGVSRLLLDKCDYRVSVPMYGNVNSLNVSTAAAVIVNEAAKQHRNRKK